MNPKKTIIAVTVIAFFLLLRLPQIITDQFYFVFDFGRDILWTRDIVVLHKPTLIGPWGSLEGIFFGPLWYYLLSIPFIISQGDPTGSVYLVLFSNILVLILMFYLGKAVKNEKFGLLLCLLATTSPSLISGSTFAQHSNILPLTTLIFIYCLFNLAKGKNYSLIAAAIIASINFHFEPAAAIFTTLTLIIFVIWQHKLIYNIKILFISLLGFIIPFIPQIIFELRHNFLETRALISYFQGNNESLGGKLPFLEKIADRIYKFIDLFTASVSGNTPRFIATLIIIVSVIVLVKKLRIKNKLIDQITLIKINILVLLVPFLSYIFIYPPELKNWYLYGLSIPILILFGFVLAFLYEQKKILGILVISFIIVNNADPKSRIFKYLIKPVDTGNIGFLSTQKKVVNWIYSDSANQPFSVYVYTAPIYEYNYQYLFWWYGSYKNKYYPEEYSYLPGKTEYVPNKLIYNAKQQELQGNRIPKLIYLVIENNDAPERIKSWLSNFTKYPIIKEYEIATDLIIQIREPETPDLK